MKHVATLLLLLAGVSGLAHSAQNADPDIARGRYMVVTGHCNNCHTPGYAEKQGNMPENEWLTGNTIGYRGPWGTTYPTNLRLFVQNLTEDQWAIYGKNAKSRPPMPWWSLHETTEQDLRAMYKFMKSLGPAGKPAPSFLPPDQEPPAPFITWPAGIR